MNGFAGWLERRRKIIGFDRQSDLAAAAGLSISIIQRAESSGSLDGKTRATRKLLADALRVSLDDLDRLARGDIDDAPFTAPAVGGVKVIDALRWLVVQGRQQQTEILGALTPDQVAIIAEIAVDRLRLFTRTAGRDLGGLEQASADIEQIIAADGGLDGDAKNEKPAHKRNSPPKRVG